MRLQLSEMSQFPRGGRSEPGKSGGRGLPPPVNLTTLPRPAANRLDQPFPASPDLVNTATKAELMEALEKKLRLGEGFSVATLNLDHLVKLRGDAAFRDAYARHSHVVADGWPIVALRRLAKRPIELVPGSDMVAPLMAMAARLRTPVAFLGSTEATLRLAAERLTAAHPGLRVAACISPPFGFDPDSATADAALAELARSEARLCLLALGAPLQERLAARAMSKVPACGFISIGAGLDFIAGSQRRAPRFLRRVGLEWLWRMLSNPGRLAGRYARCALILPGLTLAAVRMRRAR